MNQAIVVPLDGSELARQAVPVATRIARASESTLHLVGAVTLPLDALWLGAKPAQRLMHIEQEGSQRATAYLEQIAESDELRGLLVTRHVRIDNPASAILAVAQEQHAALIVLCSHGETGLRRWVLGSVALKIARQSPVPVLILRPEAVGTMAPLLTPSRSVRVLVPLDGSLMAEEVLTPAFALTRALSAPQPGALHLVSVLPFYQMEENMQLVQAVQDYLASTERHIREREGGADVTLTSSLLLHIDVASALLDLAETGKGMEHPEGVTSCDVIAMATHGQGSTQNWMLGSITERVLTATKLPLLIVRPQ